MGKFVENVLLNLGLTNYLKVEISSSSPFSHFSPAMGRLVASAMSFSVTRISTFPNLTLLSWKFKENRLASVVL